MWGSVQPELIPHFSNITFFRLLITSISLAFYMCRDVGNPVSLKYQDSSMWALPLLFNEYTLTSPNLITNIWQSLLPHIDLTLENIVSVGALLWKFQWRSMKCVVLNSLVKGLVTPHTAFWLVVFVTYFAFSILIPHISPNLLELIVGYQKFEVTYLIFLMQSLLNFTLFCWFLACWYHKTIVKRSVTYGQQGGKRCSWAYW